MSTERESSSSRRDFMGRVGQMGMAVAIGGTLNMPSMPGPTHALSASGPLEWDLSWVRRIAAATDRAVFDMPAIGDGTVLDMATRYLDNCDSVYGSTTHDVCIVLNVRTRAVVLALEDTLWQRYALGAQYDVKDPATQLPATRNPFLVLAADAFPGAGAIGPLVKRGAIVLVCDFALGHLAKRLAAKAGQSETAVHDELRAGFVPGAIAVPSGIFGLARAQNAGCALVAV